MHFLLFAVCHHISNLPDHWNHQLWVKNGDSEVLSLKIMTLWIWGVPRNPYFSKCPR